MVDVGGLELTNDALMPLKSKLYAEWSARSSEEAILRHMTSHYTELQSR